MKPKLSLAITLCGWLFPVAWLLLYRLEERLYVGVYEIKAFNVLVLLVPFVYTIIGYFVYEREKNFTRLKKSEVEYRLLSQELQLYSKALETMQLGVTLTDLEGKIIYSNPADLSMHGYDGDDIRGRSVNIFAPNTIWNPMTAEKIKMMKRWRRESVNVRKDGSKFPVMLMSDVVMDFAGNPVGVVTTCEDITHRKDYEAKILSLAHYDSLTSLPNRFLFQDRMSVAIAAASRQRQMLAVLFLDLDQFKKINDTLGHSTGDKLLEHVGRRLGKCVRPSDSVARFSTDPELHMLARFGGDEFTILLPGINQAEDAEKIAQRILDVLTKPFIIDDRELFINASIGIALYPRDGVDNETLLRKADMAMFHAKESGRKNFHFYCDSMMALKSERYSIESELRKALERNEFRLVYQPQIDIPTGRIMGFEALLRWLRSGNEVSPNAFMSVAEETGLIVPIGDWVVRTACEQIKCWQEAGFDSLSVAVTVNISVIQYRQDGFVKAIAAILKEVGVDPRHLHLELTETTLMERTEEAIIKLGELRSMGLGISIDDFGTGYSSLNYLKRFPLTILKIDQSFVKEVNFDKQSAAITKSIIELGHGLNLTVIAEGVETKEQAEFLIENGCDGLQGYFISRPLSVEGATELLKKGDFSGLMSGRL